MPKTTEEVFNPDEQPIEEVISTGPKAEVYNTRKALLKWVYQSQKSTFIVFYKTCIIRDDEQYGIDKWLEKKGVFVEYEGITQTLLKQRIRYAYNKQYKINVVKGSAYASAQSSHAEKEKITPKVFVDRIKEGATLRYYNKPLQDKDLIEIILKNEEWVPYNRSMHQTRETQIVSLHAYLSRVRRKKQKQKPPMQLAPAGTGHSFQEFSQGVEAPAKPNMQKHTYDLGASTPSPPLLSPLEPRITVEPPMFFKPVAPVTQLPPAATQSPPVALEPRVALEPSYTCFPMRLR